jgi:Flp pilus assembly protein TadD
MRAARAIESRRSLGYHRAVSAPVPIPRGLRLGVACAALAIATFAAFWDVRGNGFVAFDDDRYLTANAVVRGGLTPAAVRWAFTTTDAFNWHPLTWLSHLLDVRLFGMDAGAHHLVSVGLHAASAALLLALLVELTGVVWPAALVAALFALHPLRVESVAWAAERKDVLATLLTLAAAHAYARAARRGAVARAAAPPLLFAAALLAKPTPVTLPLALLLLDWWPLGRWSPTPGAPPAAGAPLLRLLPPARLWLEKLPLFALAAASCAVTYAVQHRDDVMSTLDQLPPASRAAGALLAYAQYLAAALWPARLAAYYPRPAGVAPAALAGAAVLLVALTALCLGAARRRPYLAVGWLWYLGTLVPMIGLVQVGEQARADRYTYLPMIGVALGVVWLAADAVRRRPPLRAAAAALALAALLALTLATRAQVRVWRDTETLFTHALAVTRGNWMAHNNLGVALAGRGRIPEAEAQFRAALAIRPDNTDALENLGRSLIDQWRAAEALPFLREATRRRPASAVDHFMLGHALEAAGDRAGALREFGEAARLAPGEPAFRAQFERLSRQ